ncbi:MAG: PD-(D/E)XK nuclease family protein [Thiohalobacteraceae bacterium]
MSLRLHPYSDDLLARSAERVLTHAASELPDLSGSVVLVADALAATPLRAQLNSAAQRRGHTTLLGLRVTTLRDWVDSRIPEEQPPLNDSARRLLLVEALRRHSGLFGEDDPWRLADSLLELFDELSLHRAALPESEDALTQRLVQGYRISGPPPAGLTREAQIVHRLWHAWQEQTRALQRPDPRLHYLDKLQQQDAIATEPYYFLVGLQAQCRAERDWIATRLRVGRAEWLLYGRSNAGDTPADRSVADCLAHFPDHDPIGEQANASEPQSAYGRFLDAVYPCDDNHLRERAHGLAATDSHSPVIDRLATLGADSAEQEARAIDIQVRQWLLAGKGRIGVVTEDRRLARRVRALLERAGIALQDSGGWALSTTSAATCVERWLQCIEEDFAHQPLLDLLKSPFFCADAERAAHLGRVYRLEHDIIQHENVGRSLERYRRHIEYRRHRALWPAEAVEPLHALLDRLETAARPLLRLHHGSGSARLFLAQLRVSLTSLGVWALLDADAAGQRVVQLWEELDAAAQQAPLTLTWQEFRIWLGRSLEDQSFRPGAADGPVQLLSLEQSQLLRFDALVVGACDRQHLPGSDRTSAFFNAHVRRDLGLPTWEARLDLRVHQFRRLLEAAPRVVLTWHREQQGEPVLPSPWLEALETLHRLAWQTGLEDHALQSLVQSEQASVASPERAPLPSPPQLPRPTLPTTLVPETITASSHQRLIDCPYRYFAADGLQLAPSEVVRERLQKSDYGERVHHCLEAFHGPVDNLPGPFNQPFTAQTRAAAIDLLQRIASAVFARDLEDNFQHRGWLKRWWRLIPSYVDWQIQRAANWQVQQVEARIEQSFGSTGTLNGRLDRIDHDGRHDAILDYKTGRIPKQADIDSGEAIQLPFYALLSPGPVEQVEYLKLDGDRVARAGALAGEALDDLRDAVGCRIAELQQAMRAGGALPAWGDPDTCRYCPMGGLCRREAWI